MLYKIIDEQKEGKGIWSKYISSVQMVGRVFCGKKSGQCQNTLKGKEKRKKNMTKYILKNPSVIHRSNWCVCAL